MRTTLTLDKDVAEQLKTVKVKLKKPIKQLVNDALRLGFEQMQRAPKRKPYRTKPHRMGLRAGFNLDNVGELLSRLEGGNYK